MSTYFGSLKQFDTPPMGAEEEAQMSEKIEKIEQWHMNDVRLYVDTEHGGRTRGILVVGPPANGRDSVLMVGDLGGAVPAVDLLSRLVALLVGQLRTDERAIHVLQETCRDTRAQRDEAQSKRWTADRERDDAIGRMDEKAQLLATANTQVRLTEEQKALRRKFRDRVD